MKTDWPPNDERGDRNPDDDCDCAVDDQDGRRGVALVLRQEAHPKVGVDQQKLE
ncbi:MAG: hypothetical protein WAL38_36050 [Solirubrobacteraceae bacterium]